MPSQVSRTGSTPTLSVAHRHWLELNDRQRSYLTIFYELDQEAEIEQRRRWYRSLPREPADTWRWIPYDTKHPRAGPTVCQQRLDAEGLRDKGAGATLAALCRRGLLRTREIRIDTLPGQSLQTQIRLTSAGRAAARVNNEERSSESTTLPQWIVETLQEITEAGPDGLPKYKIGRAAARQLGPQGLHLIEEAHPWSYQLTPQGNEVTLKHRTRRSSPVEGLLSLGGTTTPRANSYSGRPERVATAPLPPSWLECPGQGLANDQPCLGPAGGHPSPPLKSTPREVSLRRSTEPPYD